ncbi:endoplasmic reticulum domain containing protein [Grosmannia clavigera kw1407]|uniref:Endoplasmic reticulum domain containing protein n=1 Tax=Grosmannia clavigera (strain kw1407 / UAMH 11150) TaxID=655863 RepID=F0XR68_GROCL|nr:endoplasmic reticulum domain containing protein [Grosmannia clavigera kw1407]EFW99923.1 endoplasmic reticulum domain containing protein [Grosmannia clavigera kw1407]
MRLSTLVFGLLAVVAPVMASWSKEDQEIFRVRDELAGALGADVSFYDFVGVAASASVDEINKAYRKRSRSLHPDKVKQQLAAELAGKTKKHAAAGSGSAAKPKGPSAAEVRAAIKKASDMQARLSIVANILRGSGRDRYDHFLANGFPVWKGTGYYYNRYRPGFGTVLFGLFVFVGGAAHYVALYTGWKRQRDFMDRYVRHARRSAWGDSLGLDLSSAAVATAAASAAAPVPEDDAAPAAALNRKQRRMQERESRREDQRGGTASSGRRSVVARKTGRSTAAATASASAHASGTATPVTSPTGGPTGVKKRVVAQNGKVLVVDSLGDVYLEQVDDDGNVEELLLDINSIHPPTFRDTAVYRLPAWLYVLTVGRVLSGKQESSSYKPIAAADDENDVDDEASSAGKETPSTDSNEEFELLGTSTESLGRARVSGSNNGKAVRRKGKRFYDIGT